jgi:hypothetical protein
MSKIFPQGGTQPITAAIRRNEFNVTRDDVTGTLNSQQRPAEAGDVIPIVFTNAGDTGGVWLSPPALRWRFDNTAGNYINYSMCLAITDGKIPSIPVTDVYQGAKKATDIPATVYTTYGKLPPACAAIADTFDAPNVLTPVPFTKIETYVAASGQSGITFAAPPNEVEEEDLYDEAGNIKPDAKQRTEKEWKGGRLYGNGVVEFTTRSSNVTALFTQINGKLQKQAVGNGLDGEIRRILDTDPSKIQSRKFWSPVVDNPVFWNRVETFTAATAGYGGQYTVRYENPYAPVGSLFPRNFPNPRNIAARYKYMERIGSWAVVKTLTYLDYTGPRNSDIYVATGTQINITLDAFRIEVLEVSKYDYPVINIPSYNGCGGTFEGLSILGFSAFKKIAEQESTELLPDAQSATNQVYVYIRKGILVDRLIDGLRDSSNLFPDLARYLLTLNVLVPKELIDLAKLKIAAQFNAAEELYFNGVIATATNLRDYLSRVAPFFMLRFVQNNGVFALVPDLPIDPVTFKLKTGPVTPVKTFDESNITDGSLEREYVALADRKPFCAVVLWRDQRSTEPGRTRTVEVRFSGTAPEGPFEQYDLSEFCTTEAHAVKIGKYLLAKRRYTTHTVSFTTNPLGGAPASSLLQPGDIIKVNERRENSVGATGTEEYYYQIDSINETLNGEIRIEATHFPTLSTGTSTVVYTVTTGSFATAHGYC